ncbi:MAG: hypothetical protein M1836_003715 [Candelina mexicana]|nr:MAG: hypothetical protein M1836_003715 [Candelina mexicana]
MTTWDTNHCSIDKLDVSKFTHRVILSPRNDPTLTSCRYFPKLPNEDADIRRELLRHPNNHLFLFLGSKLRNFTFGSAPDNDMILKHVADDETLCWIHSYHCRFQLDENALIMLNLSAGNYFSLFSITSHMSKLVHRVAPSQKVVMVEGTWKITIGDNFHFQVRVLPQPFPGETGYVRCQLSSSPLVSSLTGARRIGRVETHARSAAPKRFRAPTPKRLANTKANAVWKLVGRNGEIAVVKHCRNSDTWKREYSILKGLKHRQIVSLTGSDKLRQHIKLDYISGSSLNVYVNKDKRSTVPVDKYWTIWLNISEAIKYLHSNQIMHNDIKPGNIILDTESGGRGAVLCDFGIATRRPDMCNGGTPSFLAPECMMGWKFRCFASDIWAFGVTMLFVMGYIPRPQHDWVIANITRQGAARYEMITWQKEVAQKRAELSGEYPMLEKMLAVDKKTRITAEDLTQGLTTLVQLQVT